MRKDTIAKLKARVDALCKKVDYIFTMDKAVAELHKSKEDVVVVYLNLE